MKLAQRVDYDNGYEPDGVYPAALVNVTNRCNLSCAHCFIFRDDNPNEALSPRREPSDDEIIDLLAELRDRHGIKQMLWMGGEPLLRKDLLRRGVQVFQGNTVTTNGTLPLIDLGPGVLYVVSLDGPEAVNDAIRGEGSFRRVMKQLDSLPAGFSSTVQVQCTVTPVNEGALEQLVDEIIDSPVAWMTFSFVVPPRDDRSELSWPDLESRMGAVDEVKRLKALHPSFIRNRSDALELMSPETAPAVTSGCLSKKFVLPLWLDGDHFTTPFCCYGYDVDCSRCGAWVVFDIAARSGLFGPH
ncbi:MAG: hypothetical protein JJLCMIEE_02427 [Acidimicrobiales bacterium]|nr:MAG: radical SAM protein [Actinomycetota bacterium]MBV6509358.1 hypothetical protein [Acidimicrobiales bacterium]RIK04606.1 MAG: hypothetical protein DCC48_12920 [Acidobacteriota bacterium]